MRLKIQKLNIQKLAVLSLFLFSWILFGFNTDNPDYENYEAAYNEGYVNSSFEIGFKILGLFFKSMGAPYSVFVAVMSFICLSVIVKCVCDYTDSPALVYVAYLLYPFFFDVIQIRMFMAGVIVLYAVRFLETFSKENVIKYGLFILFGSTIHVATLCYFLLMIVYFQQVKTVAFVSTIISILLILLKFIPFRLISSTMTSLTILGDNFTGGTGYITFAPNFYTLMLKHFALWGSVIALVSVYRCSTPRKSTLGVFQNTLSPLKKHTLLNGDFGIKLLWATMMFISMMSFGSSFGRLYSRPLILIYCISMQGKSIKGNLLSLKTATFKLYYLLFAFILFYAHIIDGYPDTYHSVFRAVLDNNSLWRSIAALINIQ